MRVLYIDVDSLRPDHRGCYGCHRDTSPNIDAIARESVRYEQVNIAEAEPEIVVQAMAYLAEWLAQRMATSTTNIDPMMTVLREGGPFHTRGIAESLIERLEAMETNQPANRLRNRVKSLS